MRIDSAVGIYPWRAGMLQPERLGAVPNSRPEPRPPASVSTAVSAVAIDTRPVQGAQMSVSGERWPAVPSAGNPYISSRVRRMV